MGSCFVLLLEQPQKMFFQSAAKKIADLVRLSPGDSEALQTKAIETFSTAVPAKIPYAEKGIHTPILLVLSHIFSDHLGRDKNRRSLVFKVLETVIIRR
jgi:hypothetical protein